eukprot:COSAG02_NODE_2701_length_8203_cov_7.719521_11_plen_120_part_00
MPENAISFNTPFALGAPVLYVELVYFLRGGNSSFRGLGQYDTPLDAADTGHKALCPVSPVHTGMFNAGMLSINGTTADSVAANMRDQSMVARSTFLAQCKPKFLKGSCRENSENFKTLV